MVLITGAVATLMCGDVVHGRRRGKTDDQQKAKNRGNLAGSGVSAVCKHCFYITCFFITSVWVEDSEEINSTDK